ncbi:trehalose-phosphatase [Pseudonocardia kujensis]|uniref:trehalose-phosphatase n=1 Tax=Pseudonocardia kujensis TaxID=1128675 RepID=UPI001E3DEA03|nr:trehalose-phosphatase [Pseudonocardia kujensis]MCE0761426.1 trehalose-phosphatase [Pseudonocardia kujensis]
MAEPESPPDGLDPALSDALDRLGGVGTLLVALDFDGVLAPIVPVPSDARPLPDSAAAVRELAEAPGTTVVLLSGRGLTDLGTVSGFTEPVRMVGSHGAEYGPGLTDGDGSLLGPAQQDLKEKLTLALVDLVEGEVGVTLEHKPAGVAVHVRNAAPEVGTRVLDAVRAGPGTWEGVDSTEGKAVIDLAVLQVSKGSAVDLLRERLGADAVFFAGDDVTDESVFTRLRPGDVGVKVGEGDTAAEHRVADPEAVTVVLRTLARARR